VLYEPLRDNVVVFMATLPEHPDALANFYYEWAIPSREEHFKNFTVSSGAANKYL